MSNSEFDPEKVYKYPDDWTDADTEAEAAFGEDDSIIEVRMDDGTTRIFTVDLDNLETWE